MLVLVLTCWLAGWLINEQALAVVNSQSRAREALRSSTTVSPTLPLSLEKSHRMGNNMEEEGEKEPESPVRGGNWEWRIECTAGAELHWQTGIQ